MFLLSAVYPDGKKVRFHLFFRGKKGVFVMFLLYVAYPDCKMNQKFSSTADISYNLWSTFVHSSGHC